MKPTDYAGALQVFLLQYPTTAERVAAVRAALSGSNAKQLRRELGRWIAGLVPVERTVPDVYAAWRPVVRDAMMFVVWRLSIARLAPKIVEQVELPEGTTPEIRLLHLIAKVPGLQKIGQLLARNRRLHPRLRQALSQLENGISDVSMDEIRAVMARELGGRLETYQVRIKDSIFSEASVSAVIRFTWVNPETGLRERGVFKVLKPYVPECYAEDMSILQRLAEFLARRHYSGEIRLAGLAETLTEIRLLLEHEVDFRREQSTLQRAGPIYGSLPGVRVPRVIEPLSTDFITALSEERGGKITSSVRNVGEARVEVAERLAETLLALPALAPQEQAIYHADPHAGNLLYDRRTGEIVILDWALTERLTRAQRRSVMLLVLNMLLRDADGVASAIRHLCDPARARDRETRRIIRRRVEAALDRLPIFSFPGAMTAMRLLEEIALEGVKFSAALLMFRKSAFTLEGVLADVAGFELRIDAVIGRYAVRRWARTAQTLASLLSPRDWVALEWSALTFLSRVALQALRRPWLCIPRELWPAGAG